MWQVNERSGNKWLIEPKRAYSLKSYSQYNCIFQNDTKFTCVLELEQLSCTLSNCTVLHEYAVMDFLVFLCFYFVDALLFAAHHVCGCLAHFRELDFEGKELDGLKVSWEIRTEGFRGKQGLFCFSSGEDLRIFKCWRSAVHKKNKNCLGMSKRRQGWWSKVCWKDGKDKIGRRSERIGISHRSIPEAST